MRTAGMHSKMWRQESYRRHDLWLEARRKRGVANLRPRGDIESARLPAPRVAYGRSTYGLDGRVHVLSLVRRPRTYRPGLRLDRRWL